MFHLHYGPLLIASPSHAAIDRKNPPTKTNPTVVGKYCANMTNPTRMRRIIPIHAKPVSILEITEYLHL